MLVVTHQAALALRAAVDDAALAEKRVIRAHAFRNAAGELDVRLELDELLEDDKTVTFDNRPILAADAEAATVLSGHTLTVEQRGGRARFALRPTPSVELADDA